LTCGLTFTQSFNKSAIKIFGYEQEEVVGCNVSMLMTGKHARRHDKYLKRYLKKGKGAEIVGHAREVTAMRKVGICNPLTQLEK
jgi:PAS domain S-box-containing protein